MQALVYEEGFQKKLISKRLMTFGANGVYVFQSTMSSVTKQIVDGWAPHSMGVALYGSYNQPCNSNFVTFANGEHN